MWATPLDLPLSPGCSVAYNAIALSPTSFGGKSYVLDDCTKFQSAIFDRAEEEIIAAYG